jgi:ArsR family transcriptional regulator, arsenate/arsenite/antimonite-responsive transcriptional repressor
MDTSTAARALPLQSDAVDSCCGGQIIEPLSGITQTAELVDLLKALADPTRLRMLDLLAQRDAPLCVCEITDRFPQNQPTISHHLRILRQAGLIAGEKRGVWSYYWATDAGKRAVSIVRTLR